MSSGSSFFFFLVLFCFDPGSYHLFGLVVLNFELFLGVPCLIKNSGVFLSFK